MGRHRRQAFVLLTSLGVLLGSGGFLYARGSGLLSGPRILSSGHVQPSGELTAYLRWLKQLEAERHKMQLNQMFSLAPLATTAGYADLLSENAPPIVGPPELAVARRFEERVSPVIHGARATQESFDRVPAPPECEALFTSYHGALAHTRTGIGKIFEKTITTIHALARSKEKSKDAAPALGFLEKEHAEKNLSHAVDASFADASAQLKTLQNRYQLPADLDEAHFQIFPG